jgi:hypothetical protein
MAAIAANVRCCGMGRKEPGRAGRRLFAELVGQLADHGLLRAAAPAERLQEGNFTPISWAPCCRFGVLLGAKVDVDPEVQRHDSVRGRHPDRVGEASDPGAVRT